MQVIPVKTRIILPEDDFIDVLLNAIEESGLELKDNDILGVAETPLGTTESRIVALSEIEPSEKAEKLAHEYELLPEGPQYPRLRNRPETP